MITLVQFDAFIDLLHSSQEIKNHFDYWLAQVNNKIEVETAPIFNIAYRDGLEDVLPIFKYCQENTEHKLNCIKFIYSENNDRGNRYIKDIPGLREAKDLFEDSIWPLLYHPNPN